MITIGIKYKYEKIYLKMHLYIRPAISRIEKIKFFENSQTVQKVLKGSKNLLNI